MVRSLDVTVTGFKIGTILVIDAPEPTSGDVPFDVDISGMLTDVDGNGLGGKVIHVYMDGVQVGTPLTSSPPIGTWGIWWHIQTITEPGTHMIYGEFEGDAEWEGCD